MLSNLNVVLFFLLGSGIFAFIGFKFWSLKVNPFRDFGIVITVSIAIFRVILNELDVRSSAQALSGKHSEDTVKAVAYTKAKHRFENANILIQMVLVLCFLIFGWFV